MYIYTCKTVGEFVLGPGVSSMMSKNMITVPRDSRVCHLHYQIESKVLGFNSNLPDRCIMICQQF